MPKNRKYLQDSKRGEILVALLKAKSDFGILQEQGWYRIPVINGPKCWPPKWLAFYQPKIFQEDAFRVQWYGEVEKIIVVPRRELFPNEFTNEKSNFMYYKIIVKELKKLDRPIISFRHRRLVFIPTTWKKFIAAEQINDLFNESPLEDLLWERLKELSINAERQWKIFFEGKHYFLDFALFCVKAPIAIETDGDKWHINPKRAKDDYIRQNDISIHGWHILRFNSKQIREEMDSYCIPVIKKSINNQGGLTDEGLVPRIFYHQNNAIQKSLFDEAVPYIHNILVDENVEM
jgi:very-short-patch-repair endonuclease